MGAREPGQVLEMLEHLWRRYGIRHFFAIDNIMPPGYIDGLFGALAQAHSDFQLHYEVRPTLTRRQLAGLKRGGIASIQPGVESLSTRLLAALRKDTTAMRNLELIKWATYHGIRNLYNLLVRIPGETREDYDAQVALITRIHHLQPPETVASLRADRGSPMFQEPARFGITRFEPARCYAHIYPPDRFDLDRVAYFFDHSMENVLAEEDYAPLRRAVAAWQESWRRPVRPTLLYVKGAQGIRIEDRRTADARIVDCDGLPARLYEFCGDARRPGEIAACAGAEADRVEGILREFVARGLMVCVDRHYLSLALPANPHA